MSNLNGPGDYLIKGKEKKLSFVKKGTYGIDEVLEPPLPADRTQYDLRKAVIKYIEGHN